MEEENPAENVNILREVLSGTSAKVVISISGFIGSIYFARELGPSLFGAVSLVYALAEWYSHPIYGIGAASKKRVSESDSRRGNLFGLLILVGFLWVSILGILVVGLNSIIRSTLSLESAPVYLVFLVSTVGIFNLFGRLVEGRGMVSKFLWTNTIRKVGVIFLQAVLIFYGFGVDGWVGGATIVSAVSISILYVLIDARPQFPTQKDIKDVWDFAKFSSVTSALYAGYSRLDLFLIGSVIGTSTAGYYEIAWKITMFGIFIPNIIGNSLMPKISALHVKDEGEKIVSELNTGASFAGIITIPMFFGALSLGEPLITTVYGSAYQPATELLIAVCLVRIVESQSDPIIAALGGINRPDVTLKITVAGILLNVLLGIPLLYAIGPVGLILSSALAETVRGFGGYLFLRYKLDVFHPIGRDQIFQITSSIAMFIIVNLLWSFIDNKSFITLCSIIVLGAIIYIVVLVALSRNMRNALRKQIVGRVGLAL
jgi:O-antigen/teichoic acid export membrane protein